MTRIVEPRSHAPEHAGADPLAGAATGGTADPLARQRVLPQRHPWRWVAVAVVLVVVAQIVHGLVTNPFFEWDRFGYWFSRPVIVDGVLVTLEVTGWSAVLGLVGGIVLALMRLSGNPVLRGAAWVYIWLFRSVPLIVLLVLLFNFSLIYPQLGLGVPFGPMFTSFETKDVLSYLAIAVLGLSLNEAAYAAEIVRGGLQSVDEGQYEAAAAIGLSRGRQLRRVVLPQALRSIVPSYVNQLIQLIKASSLVFYVSMLDLFGTVQSLQNTFTSDIVPLLLVASVWYVVLTSVLSVVQYYVERYYARGAARSLPPTPLQKLRRTTTAITSRIGSRA